MDRDKLRARQRVASKKWYHANKERAKQMTRDWQAANPEKYRELKQKYHAANRERLLAKNKAWREANRERRLTQRREHYKANRDAMLAKSRKWAEENRPRALEIVRNSQLKRDFGITLEQYREMLAGQDGRCAICGTNDPGKRSFHVDHDHSSGLVRGLLCGNCNSGIGKFKDDTRVLARAIWYLARSWKEQTA